jgi:hypothetical protein
MFRFDVRRAVGVVVVAFSLVLVGPAEAAGRAQGRASNRSESIARQAPGAWQTFMLVLGQVGTVSPYARLVATWLGEGPLIDPNGLHTVPVPKPGTNTSTTPTDTDEGPLIDPNG